ncbi:adenine phosphoribosyltransferase [Gonapodya sp. JEL0774]|nr:adenine phosphoribosyltransferase [Gonapodya sp. JEL0774]
MADHEKPPADIAGIMFQDFTPLFKDPYAVEILVNNFVHFIMSSGLPKIDAVVVDGEVWDKTYTVTGGGQSESLALNHQVPQPKSSGIIDTALSPADSLIVCPSATVGLDARGFLFGPLIALRLSCAFVPARKRGKLPGDVHIARYVKEYGVDEFEISKDGITPGQNVVVVDDLIATGGSAKAAGELVQACGGKTVQYCFVVELVDLKGAAVLDAPTYSLLKVEGE